MTRNHLETDSGYIYNIYHPLTSHDLVRPNL